jgi:hypothetical protein
LNLLVPQLLEIAMEKTSGLMLDYYDNPAGISPDKLTLLTKTAHILTEGERDKLPHDAFALVLYDNGTTLKKFAMVDAGNTLLSIEYFFKTGHQLPLEAQKTAATNLLTSCDWYDVALPPECHNVLTSVADGEPLSKLAFGLGGMLLGATMGPGALREAKSNMQAVQPAGGTIMTPDQLKAQRATRGV